MLDVAHEIVRAHRREHLGHGDRLHRADRRVVARTIVDAVERVGRAHRIGAEERADAQDLGAVIEGHVQRFQLRIGHVHAVDHLASRSSRRCAAAFPAAPCSSRRRSRGRASNSAAAAPGPEPGFPPRGITMMSSSGITVGAVLHRGQLGERRVDQRVHALGLRGVVAPLEVGAVMRVAVRVVAVLRIERIERGVEPRSPADRVSLSTAGLMPRNTLTGLPGCESANTMPSAGGKFGELVRALHQPLGFLAIPDAVLRDGLVEAHGRAAAAVTEQQHLGDARLFAQELDRRLDVERDVFEADQSPRCRCIAC